MTVCNLPVPRRGPGWSESVTAPSMSAVLLAITGMDPAPWHVRFRALAPARDIRLWPHGLGDPGGISYACVWHAPRGLLATLPGLKVIFSLGAGVDHVLVDPALPD